MLPPPYFTSIPANAEIIYGNSWTGAQFEADDETEFGNYSINDTTNFQINSSGFLNWTNQLAVGNYFVNVTINDTLNNLNSTIYNLNITQANAGCSVEFNETSPLIYPDSFRVWHTCSIIATLYRNGSEISNDSIQSLGAGNYNFTVIASDDFNYTDNIDEDLFDINKATSEVYAYINNTRGNFTSTNLTADNIYLNGTLINGQGDIVMYLNETLINEGTSPLFNLTNLSIGGYWMNVTYAETQNYTSSIESWFINITESDAQPPTFSNALNSSDNFKRYSNFTADITIDDGSDLDSYIFSNNASGSWANSSVTSMSETQYNASEQANISLPGESIICWYYWANDTFGNDAKSEDFCFDVNNTLPVMQNIFVNSSLGTNGSNEDLICWIKAIDNDDDTLNYTGFWYKNGEQNESIDALGDYTSGDLINVSTLNNSYISIGDNWSCKIRAYDGIDYSNYLISDNLTVLDIVSPEVDIVSPNATIYSSGSVNVNISLNEEGYCEYSLDAGITNNTLANNSINTEFTGTLSLTNGTYTLNAYCNDTSGNKNYTENVTFSISIPQNVEKKKISKGGGAGAMIEQELPLIVSPDSLEVVSIKGEETTRTLKITNIGDSPLLLSVSKTGEIADILEVSDSLSLEKGETKNLVVKINSPEKGLLSGKIILETDLIFEIPVIINVKSSNFLFDVGISLPEKMRTISPGEILTPEISLLQVGPQEKVDVFVTYVIKDFEGNVYFEDSETFYVLGEKSYTKEIPTEGFDYGKYFVGMEVVYPGAFATSSAQFKIVSVFYKQLEIILIVFGILALSLIILFYFFKKRRLRFYQK